MSTLIRRTRLAATLVVLFAAFAALATLLAPTTAGAVEGDSTGRPPAGVNVQKALHPSILSVAFGAGSDYTRTQLRQVRAAADRVCDGITAGVPLVDMASRLSADTGMDDTQSRNFVTVVGQQHC